MNSIAGPCSARCKRPTLKNNFHVAGDDAATVATPFFASFPSMRFDGIFGGIYCTKKTKTQHPCGFQHKIRLPLSAKDSNWVIRANPNHPEEAALAPARAAFCFPASFAVQLHNWE